MALGAFAKALAMCLVVQRPYTVCSSLCCLDMSEEGEEKECDAAHTSLDKIVIIKMLLESELVRICH